MPRSRKNAHFLYDLDALFIGTLGRCVNDDESIQSFLTNAGLGNDFGKYYGELANKITALVDKLLNGSFASKLPGLKSFLESLGSRSQWQKEQHSKARVALVTAISRYRGEIVSMASQVDVCDIEARLTQILAALEEKNIHVLPGGTLERYLPSFKGAEFAPTPDQKRDAVLAELSEMTKITTEDELASRYTDLYDAVRRFPSKDSVDLDFVLRRRLSDFMHRLQQTVVEYPDWGQEEIQDRMNSILPEYKEVFSIQHFERQPENKFQATVVVTNLLNQGPKNVKVTDLTNAGMGGFEIETINLG